MFGLFGCWLIVFGSHNLRHTAHTHIYKFLVCFGDLSSEGVVVGKLTTRNNRKHARYNSKTLWELHYRCYRENRCLWMCLHIKFNGLAYVVYTTRQNTHTRTHRLKHATIYTWSNSPQRKTSEAQSRSFNLHSRYVTTWSVYLCAALCSSHTTSNHRCSM